LATKEEKELLELQRKRRRDRHQATTKRRRQGESLPPAMGDLLVSFFKADPEAVKKIEEAKALEAWSRYVGDAAARVSRASRVNKGTLTVVVRDPAWMQQLSFLKNGILQKYRKDFPKLLVTDIFFTRYDKPSRTP
jgi:predicted nucleic acid-binding Zn ribbon protein